jgi:hypothetical protein
MLKKLKYLLVPCALDPTGNVPEYKVCIVKAKVTEQISGSKGRIHP